MIAGTAVMGLSIAWVLMMRNIKHRLYTNRLGHQVEERYLFSEPVYVYPPTPLLFSYVQGVKCCRVNSIDRMKSNNISA
jgi:hypothetical protein